MNDNSIKKSPLALREERILQKWNTEGTFKQSLEKHSPRGEFIFYDGPPFATGTPHYGHLLAGTIKDVIPRYKTMQGYHVPRRWGWDCHGLPLENLIEKELGLKTKKDIEELGVGKFNDAARAAVLRYAHVWQEIVPRFGRWVDMNHDYRSMDASYTESVWWIFKTLHDKGLIYEGYKNMHLCPRCGTTLSNFEVNQGYKDITDLSVYAKFALVNEPDTFVIAWTTTPWTLPGNVALAVGADIEYVKIKISDAYYILAKDRLLVVKEEYSIVGTMKGSELVGKKYVPVFLYYQNDTSLKNRENGWKIYAADFVTTTEGAGIVHIAPAFGSEDYDLSQKFSLPFVQHVGTDGKFKPEVQDFAGMDVKPKAQKGPDGKEEKDAHQKTDIEIIKYLAAKSVLFAKEKLIHSYPHCWRCETPLLNYASSSWFVKVTDFKDKLVAENKKILWVPSSVGENRFGKWLDGARDWAISRSRYWGAPLPVWKSNDGKEVIIAASAEALRKHGERKNTFVLMRHGQTERNGHNLVSCSIENQDLMTEVGLSQVKKSAEILAKKARAGEKFDLIVASPFPRTKQTAKIVSEAVGLNADQILFDDRLIEVQALGYDGGPWEKYTALFGTRDDQFTKTVPGVEGLADVRARVGSVLYELNKKYEGKRILIISHGTPLRILHALSLGLDRDTHVQPFSNAEIRELDFVALPRNQKMELDFHRPFIDEVKLVDSKGGLMNRVPEVFDCWFESGSMPYGQVAYKGKPVCTTIEGRGDVGSIEVEFDPKGGIFKSAKGFPADFIAEGLDQTRGWFYSMLVLGVGLFGKSPYTRVIVNGLVLAEDGKKMSKSLSNYPDPMDMVNKYGADAVRYFMLCSSVVAGEDLCFSEKGVDEVVKKFINRLDNVVSFYEMYKNEPHGMHAHTKNILDRWIVSRLNETIATVETNLDRYELNSAARPLNDFVEDLSVWYLRRSRDRFKTETTENAQQKEDRIAALETIRYVLVEFSKLLAPFMPFFAEDVFGRATGISSSVHLEHWPKGGRVEKNVIDAMRETRILVTSGLEARVKVGIKVRQPLAALKVKKLTLSTEYTELVENEVNVKKVLEDQLITEDVSLDTVITPLLKEEGKVRELLRALQELRKEKGFTVGESAILFVSADEQGRAFIASCEDELKKTASLSEIRIVQELSSGGHTITLDDIAPLLVEIKK